MSIPDHARANFNTLLQAAADGNLALMVFGAGLLHALITAPQGVSGQVVNLSRLIAAKLSAAMPRMMERKL